MLALFALPSAWSPQVDGRAVASRRSAISLGAALFAPLPAFAKSKEKAKQEAIQKETAKNAKQAMKEYKYAPRPELEYGLKPDGTMGYIYKEGTVKKWFDKEGFGFITPCDGSDDVFVHSSNLDRHFACLTQGEKVHQ